MKCRTCNSLTKRIYKSPKIPEYIWPGNYKKISSSCIIFSCTKCYSFQLQKFTKKKIKSFYGNEIFNEITKKEHLKRIKILKKKYGYNFLKNKKIIDIGGGVNPILNSKLIDILDFKISKENKIDFKGKIYKGDVENKKISKKYDVIFLLHTLEHLLNPFKALNNIKEFLRDNGRIFVEVPNFDYFIKKRPHYAVFHQHINMYNIQNLKNLFTLCQLSIEHVFESNQVIFCSVIKNDSKKKMIKINSKGKIKILSKTFQKQRKLLVNFSKNQFLDVYGAGGSATLFLANNNFIKKKIQNIYDNDKKKIGKKIPGIDIIIKKSNQIQKNKSISFYKINYKNNLFLNEI